MQKPQLENYFVIKPYCPDKYLWFYVISSSGWWDYSSYGLYAYFEPKVELQHMLIISLFITSHFFIATFTITIAYLFICVAIFKIRTSLNKRQIQMYVTVW